MPRALIPAYASTSQGVVLGAELTPVVVDGAYLVNNPDSKLHVRNADAASQTVTIKFARTVDGKAVSDRTQVIAAGAEWVFGPFNINDYGSQVLVDVTSTNLKLRVVE
jgi:hypothetical protein